MTLRRYISFFLLVLMYVLLKRLKVIDMFEVAAGIRFTSLRPSNLMTRAGRRTS